MRASLEVGANRKIGVERVAVQSLRKGARLLWRVVDHQDAVHPGVEGRSGKSLDSHRLDRIGVAHQNDRRVVVVGTEIGHHLEHFP
jgi:hypothetical protein